MGQSNRSDQPSRGGKVEVSTWIVAAIVFLLLGAAGGYIWGSWSFRDANDRLAAANEELFTKYENLDTAYKQLKEDFTAISEEIAVKVKELEAKNATIKDLELQIKLLNQSSALKDERIDALEIEVEELSSTIQGLEDEIQGLEELEDENKDLKDQIDDLENQIDDLEARIRDLKDDIRDLKKRLGEAEALRMTITYPENWDVVEGQWVTVCGTYEGQPEGKYYVLVRTPFDKEDNKVWVQIPIGSGSFTDGTFTTNPVNLYGGGYEYVDFDILIMQVSSSTFTYLENHRGERITMPSGTLMASVHVTRHKNW